MVGMVPTTTEDTPVFDRSRVSLDIPSAAFGTSFTLLTNVSKVLNKVILVSRNFTLRYISHTIVCLEKYFAGRARILNVMRARKNGGPAAVAKMI